jgi:hypothetical protein
MLLPKTAFLDWILDHEIVFDFAPSLGIEGKLILLGEDRPIFQI